MIGTNSLTPTLSVADWCLFPPQAEAEQHYRSLRDLGIAACEMVPASRRPVCRAAGLQILNLSGPGMDKGLNRRAHHGELIPKIEASIAEAAREGIAQVIVFSGRRDGQAHPEGVAQTAEALSPLARQAGEQGVMLLLELLNSWNHPDYAADHMPWCLAVVEAVGSPHLRILYDCYHALRMGADVAGDLARHAGVIGHIHVADPRGRGVPRPDGFVPWPDYVRIATAAGYRGCWGLEFKPQGEVLAEIVQAARLLANGQREDPEC